VQQDLAPFTDYLVIIIMMLIKGQIHSSQVRSCLFNVFLSLPTLCLIEFLFIIIRIIISNFDSDSGSGSVFHNRSISITHLYRQISKEGDRP